MDDLSLAHSRYNCTYHIVFIPKYRRKVVTVHGSCVWELKHFARHGPPSF